MIILFCKKKKKEKKQKKKIIKLRVFFCTRKISDLKKNPISWNKSLPSKSTFRVPQNPNFSSISGFKFILTGFPTDFTLFLFYNFFEQQYSKKISLFEIGYICTRQKKHWLRDASGKKRGLTQREVVYLTTYNRQAKNQKVFTLTCVYFTPEIHKMSQKSSVFSHHDKMVLSDIQDFDLPLLVQKRGGGGHCFQIFFRQFWWYGPKKTFDTLLGYFWSA